MAEATVTNATQVGVDMNPHVDSVDGARGVRKDVWSRSGSKYRVRAIVLLAVNVLLFAGVGSFAFWIRSGEMFAPAVDSYADEFIQTFRFGQQTAVSLASFLMEPIDVQDVPMQIVIMGLLMAALISIPILVSILYKFWSSLPFIGVVGFLAVMPWLAITLLFSCIIASARPLRSRFRFMSALLGLVPTVIYLVLAWRGSAEAIAGEVDPVDRIKFVAPWVLAVVSATIVFAVVLTIARLVDYRPGAITPLLAIMFGLPLGLFEAYVGRDELHYRLLESLNEAHFADVDASVELRHAALRAWQRRPLPRPTWDAVLEAEELKWQFLLASDMGPVRTELTRHQDELAKRCDWFHAQFPTSRYTANALYIKARALDMRVDPMEFRKSKWIRFYDDFPSARSRPTWTILAENRPDSVLGAVPLLRLARLDAREGDVERAIDKLRRLIRTFDDRRSGAAARTAGREGGLKGVLTRESPEASLSIPLDRVLLEAHCLLALLTHNRDPLYGNEPLTGSRRPSSSVWFGLLDLDPRHERYAENLEALKAAYPHGQLEDNIDLEIAKVATSLSERIARLEALLDRFSKRDAAPEALFRLGAALKEAGRTQRSEDALSRLYAAYPDSVWAAQASRYSPRLAPPRSTGVSP